MSRWARGWIAAFGCIALWSAPASARDKLRTIWTLEPIGQIGPLKARWGRVFLEERLVPQRLVKLGDTVVVGGKPVAAAGELLFVVYDAETHRPGFCTIKDRSLNRQARTLFIPILDKRPCFIDRDGDGKFDASFPVFDKAGRTMTPTGNMAEAVALPEPVGFEDVDPHLYPVTPRISFYLSGSKNPDRTEVTNGGFDKGDGYDNSPFWYPVKHDGPRFTVANLVVTINQVIDGEASFTVATDPAIILTTDKDGNVVPAPLPDFLAR